MLPAFGLVPHPQARREVGLRMETTTQIYLEITPESGQLLGEAMAEGYETGVDIEGFDLTVGAKIKGSGEGPQKQKRRRQPRCQPYLDREGL